MSNIPSPALIAQSQFPVWNRLNSSEEVTWTLRPYPQHPCLQPVYLLHRLEPC